jgi:hypothetical protein
LGVNYFVVVPADTEFPHRLGQLELFVRLLSEDEMEGRVLVTISPIGLGADRPVVIFRKWAVVPTVVAPGPILVDTSFKLMNVVVPDVGTYAVRVLRRRRRRPWENKHGWRRLATEYFFVVRAT